MSYKMALTLKWRMIVEESLACALARSLAFLRDEMVVNNIL